MAEQANHHPKHSVSREQLQEKVAEIRRLRAALRVLLDQGDDVEYHSLTGDDDIDASSDGDTDEDPVEPIWDSNDGIYRCPKCAWEIAEGVCEKTCLASFKWDNNKEPENIDQVAPTLSISLDVGEPDSDRMLTQRGTTPLLDIDRQSVFVPYTYRGKPSNYAQYLSLLERGATLLMCETFYLEYTDATGIVAWADGDIYEQFAGPGMQHGDFWKIYLGRRVCLDSDDYDGSQFLEAFLEENLLFPLTGPPTHGDGPYETVQESPGIWATRPRKPEDNPFASDASDAEERAEDHDNDRLQWMEMLDDEALVVPVEDNGPVHRVDKGYETEDTMSNADINNESSELACSLGADREYLSDWDGEESSSEQSYSSDSEDSLVENDFDSDELLSGDEEVILGLRNLQST